LKAFKELQSYLCSEPVVDYPRRDRTYALITDASLGDDKKPGGLGAILTQIKPDGEHCVIAYASRKLQKHEKNYTPYLLEMQAAIWGMEHFNTHLRGRHFILFTDHKPLEKLGKVHTKTLNRLQEAMNEFDFEIIYKKGSEMPADYLSRNIVAAISWDNEQLQTAQDADPLIKALKLFLLHKELPRDEKCQSLVRHFANDCFVEDDIVWRRIKRQFEPSRVVIFLPHQLVQQVLQDAHGQLLTGHDGIYKTKERIFQCYYWPGMDADIGEHLKSCHKCQLRRKNDAPPPALLTPMPQPSEPNQRVHADLFGPLKTSGNNKKFVLCITDAFTKYVELVALPNKEAATVAAAIFEKWFCRHGVPLDVITDQGKEFCAELTEDLFKLMKVDHLKTTAYHPQCNSQAEVANKTIAKYLASFVDDTTLDWEDYLAPLMFCYNTSFHRSIKSSPYFLTHGLEARQPGFPTPDVRRKFYGESSTDELMHRLLMARDVARRNNEAASEQNQDQFDRKAEPHQYRLHQLVLLNEHSFLHKNAKLAPKWSGPHRIVKLKNDNNFELKLRNNNRKLIVHANRLKPYIVPNSSNATFVEIDKNLVGKSETTKTDFSVEKQDLTEKQDRISQNEDVFRFHEFSDASREVQQPQRTMSPAPPPPAVVKRGRGRPKKIISPPLNESSSTEAQAQSLPLTGMEGENLTKRKVGRPAKIKTSIPPAAVDDSLIASRTRSRAQRSENPPATTPQEGGGIDVAVTPDVTSDVTTEATGQTGQVFISLVDNDEASWITVTRKINRKNRSKQIAKGWTKQQKENFYKYGDIYKSVQSSDFPSVVQQPPPDNQHIANDDQIESDTDESQADGLLYQHEVQEGDSASSEEEIQSDAEEHSEGSSGSDRVLPEAQAQPVPVQPGAQEGPPGVEVPSSGPASGEADIFGTPATSPSNTPRVPQPGGSTRTGSRPSTAELDELARLLYHSPPAQSTRSRTRPLPDSVLSVFPPSRKKKQ